MGKVRKPFQGVFNIIRFNRHFYILASLLITILFFAAHYFHNPFRFYIELVCVIIIGLSLISLLISFYIYDLSGLYDLKWLNHEEPSDTILNINAGFDETSHLLQHQYPNSRLIVLDFYDPLKHTEISLTRARKAYPPYHGTLQINSNKIPLSDQYADKIFLLFAAHEIRDSIERIIFFNELNRILKPDGKIILTEHLRDPANFVAYTIGFFHFYSKKTWLNTIMSAGLSVQSEKKPTPFISTFILVKDGNTI